MLKFLKKNRFLLLLIVILAVASFFRLWQLNSVPPGLYPDVAINGNNALETLKTGNFNLFYPDNNGREGLIMWLIAFSFLIFGASVWSIKIVAATFGILTVLGLYLLTKELFAQATSDKRQATSIALLASFFLAISFWHTNFSRIGFRAILVPFVLVFGFYFLFKGFRTKSIWNFLISGIFFGSGFYTYISYRLVVLLLPVTLLVWWFICKKENLQKKYLLFTFYFLLFTFIVALPIGIYFLQNPQDFIGRAAPISIFSAKSPLIELGKSLIAHLGMFNFYGDPNWRHNYSESPMLYWPMGILFLIGIIFSIKNFISSLKNKDYSLFIVHCTLLAWFLIMLLPGVLTYEGIPHSLRVVGVIPVVYIFTGLGGFKIYEFFEKNTGKRNLLIISCILFLVAISFSEFNKYFFAWGKNKEVEGAFTQNFANMGYFLNSLPENTQKYVIVNESGTLVPLKDGLPMPAQTIMFIENAKYGSLQFTPLDSKHLTGSIYLLPKDLNQIKINETNQSSQNDIGKAVILPMKYDESLFDELRQKFPLGELEEKNGFWIMEIEK
jgi:4-amino-4-deoxy-L-arabinose transferase-like glycosyltransferase